MRTIHVVVLVTTGFLLACGGGGAPAHGSIAYTTYEKGSTRYRFKTEDQVVKTWRNMAGDPVQGTYTHSGDLVEITWDPQFDNHAARFVKMRQIDACSLAEFSWEDDEGVVHDDDSKVYQQKEPRCEQ